MYVSDRILLVDIKTHNDLFINHGNRKKITRELDIVASIEVTILDFSTVNILYGVFYLCLLEKILFYVFY